MKDYDLTGIGVLVVDDSAMMRELLSTALRTLGIRRVVTAEDGEIAETRIQTFRPDIILLDILMPKMNGIEFLQKLRTGQYDLHPFVPVIVISGYTDFEHIAEARDAGTNEFLAKPISVRTLYSRIVALIDAPRQFVRCDEFVGPDRRRRSDRRDHEATVLDLERRQGLRRHDDEGKESGPSSPFEGFRATG